jgi:hypothetical protein
MFVEFAAFMKTPRVALEQLGALFRSPLYMAEMITVPGHGSVYVVEAVPEESVHVESRALD